MVVYIINRLPTPVLQHHSPYFKLYNREPDYQKLKVFDCLCYPLLQPYGLHKLEYRSKPCIFLGYNFGGYKCLDHVTNKAYLSKNVIFDEQSFPAKDQADSHLQSKTMQKVMLPCSFLFLVQFHILCLLFLIILQLLLSHHLNLPFLNQTPLQAPIPSEPQPPAHLMTTRSRIGSFRPKSYLDFQLYQATLPECEPMTYKQAASDPRWQAAMQSEFDALIQNGTWTLCPRP
jgi:hypothetical protein